MNENAVLSTNSARATGYPIANDGIKLFTS